MGDKMTIAYWIVAGLAALAFLAAGFFKLTQSKEALKSKGMAWTDDYSANAVKGIGAAELLGAIGLIAPPLTGIAPVLAPIAAIGLTIIMVLAARTHRRRSEPIIPNVVLGLLTLAAAVLGYIVWV